MTDIIRAALGPGLAALLPAETHDAALTVFRLIADAEGADVARAWLIGVNPLLDDRAPFDVIRDGDAAAVIAAARSYLT
jgi:hypothetical protein